MLVLGIGLGLSIRLRLALFSWRITKTILPYYVVNKDEYKIKAIQKLSAPPLSVTDMAP